MDGGAPDGAIDGEVPDGGVDGGPDVPPGCGPGPFTEPTITLCPGDALPSLASGVCEVTPGNSALLITGDVLTPGEVLRGGQVLVDGSGGIVCVGCDCSEPATDATLTCTDAVVSPGLINAHDHITYANNWPIGMGVDRYEHRHDWRNGKNGHVPLPYDGGASTDTVLAAELRFVMGGATSSSAIVRA